jgi:hypothetical protein
MRFGTVSLFRGAGGEPRLKLDLDVKYYGMLMKTKPLYKLASPLLLPTGG